MTNPQAIKFSESARLNAIQMQGVNLKYCGEQLTNFQYNCRLMMSVITAPPFMTITCLQWSEAGTKAMRETFGEDADLATCLKDASEERVRDFERLSHSYMADIVKVDMVSNIDGSNPIQSKMDFANKTMDMLLTGFHPTASEMFGNLLKALVIQAWATFEAMTKELWESVANSSNLSFHRPQKGEKDVIGFSSKDKIRNSYDLGFNDPAIACHLHRQKIDALALLRNVLVHHGGKVDQIFKSAASHHPSLKELSSLPDGTVIPVTGPMVISVIEPAINSGYGLIAAVDDWIEKNP